MLYLAIFPTAYFLHAAYSESLFLLLVLGSFYAARRERWAWAGALGALATFTRITGFGLIPALLVEYLIQKRFRLREIRADVLYLALVPLGLGVYMLVNYVVLGDAVALVAAFRLRLSYVVFVLLAWANFGFNSWWISTARYLLVLFPAFILLALWGERRPVHWLICLSFFTSYTILMLVYVQGPWTF